MASNVFGFRWSVPAGGFQWIQSRIFVNDGGTPASSVRHDSRLVDTPQWVLTDGVSIGKRFQMRVYDPLHRHSGLFRTFAGLPYDDKEALLTFANEYGRLGIGNWLAPPENETAAFAVTTGETWNNWIREIDALRRAIEIWDLVCARDKVGLSRFIFWQDEVPGKDGAGGVAAGWGYDSHLGLPKDVFAAERRKVAFPGWHAQVISPVGDLFSPLDVLVPASFLVQEWVNKHLEGHVSPRLVYNLDRGDRVMQIVPDSLLAAMWLQFAHSIEGHKSFRSCKQCGKWFELSHKQSDRRTVRREFCTDQCKSRDYRRRKDMAVRLRSEGKKPLEIARELNTEIETIREWIAKRK